VRSDGWTRSGAVILTAVAVLAAAPAVPSPVLVDEPGDLPARLELSPALQRVEVDPDDGAEIGHRLAQGLDGEVRLDLAATEVVSTDDGPIGGEATEGLRLPADAVVLRTGERATIVSAVGPTAAGRALALTATPTGGTPLTGLIALVPAGRPDEVAADVRWDGESVTITATSLDAPAIVDIRLRLRGPLGGVRIDRVVGPLLLLPDEPRSVSWMVEAIPVPLTATAVVVPSDGSTATATTRVPPRAEASSIAAAVAGIVALLLLVSLWRRTRRRRRDRRTTVPDGPPA